MAEGDFPFQNALRISGGQATVDADGNCIIEVGGSRHRVSLLRAGVMFPRDARVIAWDAGALRAAGSNPLIVAEAVSEGAREFLRAQSIGYCDEGGSLFLPLPGSFILIDRAPPKREKRAVKGILSGRTSLAAHVLMSADRPLKGVEIAAASGLSLGAVSAALDGLDRMGWLATDGSGRGKLRRISDRRGLLERWRASRLSDGPRDKKKFYVPQVRSAEDLVRRIHEVADKEGVEYALTGVYGAQLHAPYLTSVPQVVCRVAEADVARLADALGARHVSDGWNMGMIVSDVPMAPPFRSEMGGLWVSSPLMCWVDAIAEGGRALELADHLARERLL
jgi:Uncharacterized protein conserved in bacteria